MRLAKRGGKNAKRGTIVAVARKLAVLLHKLWDNGERLAPAPVWAEAAAPAVVEAAVAAEGGENEVKQQYVTRGT